ncbi:uncharacterized protein [Haliotis asinina]|uniref:uncharacterized protein n=1 Tax=Haliotis asinina TaxID=109174 RepID=UPI0035327E47
MSSNMKKRRITDFFHKPADASEVNSNISSAEIRDNGNHVRDSDELNVNSDESDCREETFPQAGKREIEHKFRNKWLKKYDWLEYDETWRSLVRYFKKIDKKSSKEEEQLANLTDYKFIFTLHVMMDVQEVGRAELEDQTAGGLKKAEYRDHGVKTFCGIAAETITFLLIFLSKLPFSLQKRTSMSFILVVAACLCALCLTLQASDGYCDHPTVQEVVPGKEHDYIQSVGSPSMYDCAAECQLSPQCMFFTFDPEKRACKLLRKTNPSFSVGTGIFLSNIQEWKMPLIGACRNASCGPSSRCILGRKGNTLCSSYIGMVCTRDDDCTITRTKCFLGRCLCHPGYSHNIRTNSCDRDCKSYGDTMTPYKELAILGHNRKKFMILGKQDAMAKCMSACVQESSFICKTIDFRQVFPKCQLSSEGYLDVTAEERQRKQRNWWLAVRKCQ